MLNAADVYVLLKVLALAGRRPWVQSSLAAELGVSPSVVNRALRSAEGVGLYHPQRKRVNGPPLEDALVHGARYFLAPTRGGELRGKPTAWAAPPLVGEIASCDVLPPVWPDSESNIRGLAVEPLHPSASRAAERDPAFYELLALVDTLRLGGPRERALASLELHRRVGAAVAPASER